MSVTTYADFSDEAYRAFQNGDAVDNNGFRSRNGSFYPDQPSYRPIDERQERLKNEGTDLLCAVFTFLVIEVVLPKVKQFNDEKIYPFVAEKWDDLQMRIKARRASKQGTAVGRLDARKEAACLCPEADDTDTAGIISFDAHRKKA